MRSLRAWQIQRQEWQMNMQIYPNICKWDSSRLPLCRGTEIHAKLNRWEVPLLRLQLFLQIPAPWTPSHLRQRFVWKQPEDLKGFFVGERSKKQPGDTGKRPGKCRLGCWKRHKWKDYPSPKWRSLSGEKAPETKEGKEWDAEDTGMAQWDIPRGLKPLPCRSHEGI